MTSKPLDGQPPLSARTQTGTRSLTKPNDQEALTLALLMEQNERKRKQEQWASWVDAQYTRCRNARVPFERQWYINLAFTAGKQYVAPIDVPTQGFRLTTPKAPPWRVRLVINKTRVAVRTECSKLTTSKPIPVVAPATNEDEDFSASKVAEQLLKSEFATAAFESTYRSWIWWGVVCGTSYLKIYYDPQKLDHDAKKLPPAPTMPGSDEPLPEDILEKLKATVPGLGEALDTPRPAQGKICVERVTPFHIYAPDLLTEDINEQPYIIQVMTKSPLWVQKKFGFMPSPDARASNTILDAATIIAKGSEEHLDSVLVKECWIKPNGHPDFPDGGVVTVINSRVVQVREEWPYPFEEYPFYKYNGIPTGGYYSDSSVVDLIPLQKEYNKKRSQMIEIQNMMGKPKLVYQRGSLNPKRISSEPGQSIEYTAGYEKPEVLPGVEVPMSFVNELEKLQQEFDDVSGQHEISRGQTSLSSLTSGTAIAYLQEQDDAKLNYQVAAIETAMELLGKHYLELAGKYWDDDRLIRVTGANNAFEAMHWKKGMLKGNTDVRVQTGSALPFSKAAKTALLTEFMQNGFVDPVSGMERMDMGGMDKILDDALVDKRQAVRENLKMADAPDKMLELLLNPAPGPEGQPPYEAPQYAPQDPAMEGMGGPPQPVGMQQMNGDGTPFVPKPPVPVNSWDNHAEHIRWHNHFRKTQEFEMLSDLKKQAFELHVQLHQIALQGAMMNQMGMQLMGPNDDDGMPGSGMQQDPNALPPGEEGQQEEQFDQDGYSAQETS